MSLISPNFDVKSIIFFQFLPGAFSQNCWKRPCNFFLLLLSSPMFLRRLYYKQHGPRSDCPAFSVYFHDNIRIYHECAGRIEKSVPRIAVWHHEACRVMTNGDPKGQIFLSYSLTNNGFFFLLTTVFFQKSLNRIRCICT